MNDIITTIDTETEVSRYLYRFIFNRVVSRPHAELRHNVHLDPISTSSNMNSFTFNGNHYQLPYSGSWFLFLLDNRHVHHIRLPDEKTWTCLADRPHSQGEILGYCTKHHIDVRIVCGSTGLCIPRRHVFILPYSDQTFLVAISSNAIITCTNDSTTSPNDLWINFYYHHESWFTVKEYASANLEGIINPIVYQNGYVVLDITSVQPTYDGMTEIVEDPDIVGSFDVEVKDDYHANGTYTLFHIPHALNPNHDIIGHAVCDIILYKEGSTVGIYLNRAGTAPYVQTLTHNDFGISTGYLRGYAASLIRDGGTLHAKVLVRNHHRQDLTLARDANYTNCLYQLDDETIINHLLGKGPVKVWSAVSLSKSKYTKILDTDYSEIVSATLEDSINALGYTAAADTICKRVIHLPVYPGICNNFTVTLPICYIGKHITTHIYLDGLMVDPDYVKCQVDKQLLHVKILPNVKLGPYGCNMKSIEQYMNDLERSETHYFTVELFEYTPYRAKRLTIASGSSSSFVVDQDYRVYSENTVTSRNAIQDKLIYKRFKSDKIYTEFSALDYDRIQEESMIDSYRKVTIKNTSSTTKTYLVVSKKAYAKVCGVEHQLKEMNYDIFCSPKLMVDALEFPDFTDRDEVEETTNRLQIPYLNKDQELLVYLNRRELTQGLDYQIYQIKSKLYGSISGQFIVFQNVDYLTVANNIFEAYSVMEYKMISTAGFLTDGRPTMDGYLADYANTGVLFTDGKCYDHDPLIMVGMYDTFLHTGVRAGASAKLRAFVPDCMKQIFDKYAKYDPTTLKSVLDYIETTRQDVESPAIIERSHHIYSIFLQTITEDVLRGKFVYNEAWSDDRIKANLKKYEDLIPFDIGLSKDNISTSDPLKFIQTPSSGLDFRFVDVLPTYRLDPYDPDLVIQDKYPVVRISESSHADLNGTYICMNPDLSFVRPGERYCDHTEDGIKRMNYTVDQNKFNDKTQEVWQNSAGCMISHFGPYWILLDSNNVLRARAWDPRGDYDIWTLDWECLDEDTFQIATTEIEIHTAGEFPARRIAYTTNISDRNFLTKVARIYLNNDLVQDGVNIQ